MNNYIYTQILIVLFWPLPKGIGASYNRECMIMFLCSYSFQTEILLVEIGEHSWNNKGVKVKSFPQTQLL